MHICLLEKVFEITNQMAAEIQELKTIVLNEKRDSISQNTDRQLQAYVHTTTSSCFLLH